MLKLVTDLASSSKSEAEVKEGLFLDVVVRDGQNVLELLASEDEPLLMSGNSRLVLDLVIDVFDVVGRLYLESMNLSSEGLEENLHSSTRSVTVQLIFRDLLFGYLNILPEIRNFHVPFFGLRDMNIHMNHVLFFNTTLSLNFHWSK